MIDRRAPSRALLPLALIGTGLAFLIASLVPGQARPALIVLGIGAAFVVGRFTTGRYGYAVPAGLLLGVGSFLALLELRRATGAPLQSFEAAGWFFLLFGVGYLGIYVIGGQPQTVWPLFTGVVFICIGAFVFVLSTAASLAPLAWIASYWPVVIVLVGAWLFVRDSLPDNVRRPVGTIGGLALIAYGLLAAAATIASAGTWARPSFGHFGAPPIVDTLQLEAPLTAEGLLSITNSSGRTNVRVGEGAAVRVQATRRYTTEGEPPEVQLTNDGSGLRLGYTSARNRFSVGPGVSVDFDVAVPATAGLSVRSSSGSVVLDGIKGPVDVQTSSGSIKAAGLERLREAHSSSGEIDLAGVFREATQIRTSSGDVEVHFDPASSTRIDVRTSSGDIGARSLSVAGERAERRRPWTATLGDGAGTLTIETSSGDVTLRSL